jgi:ABC-2 type transport system ATP-binding protein
MFTSVSTLTPLASRPAAAAAVEISGLRKQFGDQVVVDDVAFQVRAGTVTGLVGSGKTTVLAMVAGVLPPDEGTVRVFDVDLWEDRQRVIRSVANTPLDGSGPRGDLTAWATLTSAAKGLDPEEVVVRTWDLLTVTGLAEQTMARVSDLTAGMRSRLMLARALLGRPALLVLDEPFRDADEESALTIRLVLERFVAEGGTVVLSGPHPHGLCDEVLELG